MIDDEQTEPSTAPARADEKDAGPKQPAVASDAARDGRDSLPPPRRVDAGKAEDDSCGGESYIAQGKALEVLVLFDNSTSMILPAIRLTGELVSLWDVAVKELENFVSDPRSRGISLALKYFGTECDPDFYSTPDVPMGALPAHGAAIVQSLHQTLPIAETATRPALEGALDFLRQRASGAGKGARQLILLVTDGYPDEADCPNNSTQAASAVAADGYRGAPSIATYASVTVTGIVLDDIARAGGTDKTLLADLGRPGALADALAVVRDQELAALPCEYELPEAYFSDVNDPALVNLTRDGKVVPQVRQSDCGDDALGWFYDDPQAPQCLLTCPATCTSLKTATAVEVQLSCPTVVVI